MMHGKESRGRKVGWQAVPKNNLKTHLLKGSPNQTATTTCTSSLLHARRNKINEMPTGHRSGCREGARNPPLNSNECHFDLLDPFSCNA